MENYGWSIELNPGYVLIIGNAPDAHIQLDSAYGRAVRVGLQVKDDISCAMLSEYSSSYNTLVNGKSIQRIATVKNHDFISIGDFTAYYNNGKIFFDYGAIRTNGVEVRPESLDIHTTYPVFIRNTRIQAKRDKTPIEILDPGTIPTKPELNLVTSLMPSIIMFALVVLLRGVMSKSNGAFVAFSICSMGVGVFTSIFGIINKQKKYKKDLVKRRDTYLEYIAKKRNEIEAARREELDCLNAQYYSIEQDIEHIENFDPVLFDRISTDEDFLEVYLGRGNVESLRQVDYKKQEKLEVGDDLSSLPEHVAGEYMDIEKAPVVMSLKDANAVRLQKFVDAGAFFVCQVVSGDMLYVKADGLLQITFPAFVRFAGKAVDKVDAYIIETRTAAMMYGIDGLRRVMGAVQQFQGSVVKSLYSHADTVERQSLQHDGVFFGQGVGIGFKSNFPAMLHSIVFPDGFKYFPEIFFRKL